MAEIYLVRHGQASFGAKDYDQLSELGKTQCRMLGESMNDYLDKPVLVTGSLNRHFQSMTSFAEGYGLSPNEPFIELSELNEFDHEDVLHVAFPEFKDRAVMMSALAKSDEPKKHFHHLFQSSVQQWVSGEFDDHYIESWPDFKKRVGQGLTKLRALSRDRLNRGKPLIAFTSGGPISGVVQLAMELNDKATISLNENLVNSGVTRLLSSERKLSVSFVNNYSHLQVKPNLISYR